MKNCCGSWVWWSVLLFGIFCFHKLMRKKIRMRMMMKVSLLYCLEMQGTDFLLFCYQETKLDHMLCRETTLHIFISLPLPPWFVKCQLISGPSAPIRANSSLAPSQWEMLLQSNTVSHWLGANLESALPSTLLQGNCLSNWYTIFS